MIWTPNAFLALGITITKKLCMDKTNLRAETEFFKTTYGVSADVCAHTWEYLTKYRVKSDKTRPHHLLWALIFLNVYESETFLARLFGATEKTFRKWTWNIIDGINQLYGRVVSNN
jgi:hypothetical protein